jgi:hypothetical protein
MRIPAYLEVAQWALLFGLAALVIVLYRQLGRLLGHSDAEREQRGPAPGSRAAPIRYYQVPGGARRRVAPGDGQPLLLAFVDPTCPACEQLVSSLSAPQVADELLGVRILLLMSDPPDYVTISQAFQATSLEIGRPVSAAEVASYRPTSTPLLVAINRAGTVRATGIARMPAEILALSRAILTESEAAR